MFTFRCVSGCKICMKLRCFLEKFTQLTKLLHDRRSRRSRQIPSLCEPFADLPIERTSYNTIYSCIIHYILSIIHYILYITLRFTVLFGISCSSLMLHYLSSLCVKAALINIKININLNMTINININMKINININMKINININMKINININMKIDINSNMKINININMKLIININMKIKSISTRR